MMPPCSHCDNVGSTNRIADSFYVERGLNLSHTTIMRWVHEFGPEIDKRFRPLLKPTNDSYRVDETYIKVKGQWKYLYRAVDSTGNTQLNN
jgi:IS6 family transposase